MAAPPVFTSSRRGPATWLLEQIFGADVTPRFSLRALVAGVLLAGLSFGMASGELGGWLCWCSFPVLVLLGLLEALVWWEHRARKGRVALRAGSLMLAAFLMQVGLVSGWTFGLIGTFVGTRSLYAQYRHVKAGLEQYMSATGAYPARIADLAPGYLAQADVAGLDPRVLYSAPAMPGGPADLLVGRRGGIWTWEVKTGLLLPPKAVAGTPASSGAASSSGPPVTPASTAGSQAVEAGP